MAWLLTNPLARAICAFLAGLLAFVGYGALKKREGRSQAKSEAEIAKAKDYAATRKRMDDAQIIDDEHLARRWLQSRNPDQR